MTNDAPPRRQSPCSAGQVVIYHSGLNSRVSDIQVDSRDERGYAGMSPEARIFGTPGRIPWKERSHFSVQEGKIHDNGKLAEK